MLTDRRSHQHPHVIACHVSGSSHGASGISGGLGIVVSITHRVAAFWPCQACSNCLASFRSAAGSFVASMALDIRSVSNSWVVVRLRDGAKEESMVLQQLPQSENGHSVPYITVEQDARGGACWAVVGLGTTVHCYSGHHAIAVMEMMCTATGVVTP